MRWLVMALPMARLPDAATTCGGTYGVVSGTTFDDITVGAGEITNIVDSCA